MKITLHKDQRGALHWQVFLVLGLVIAVSVVAFQRVAHVQHDSVASNLHPPAVLAATTQNSNRDIADDDTIDSNKCAAKLQSESGAKNLQTVRAQMLSRMVNRQKKVSSYVSSPTVNKLPNDFKDRIVNGLGKTTQAGPGTVQYDLSSAIQYIKNTNDSAAIIRKTCDTIVATHVYVFWPTYINTLANTGKLRQKIPKLNSAAATSTKNFQKSKKQNNKDLADQIRGLRTTQTQLAASQNSLVRDLLALEPTNVSSSATTKQLFAGYNQRIKDINSQARTLAASTSSFNKTLKTAPRTTKKRITENFLMYDSVAADRIPANAQFVAGYVDNLANIDSMRARFPDAVVLSISVVHPPHRAHVLDIEPGGAQLSDAPGWYRTMIKSGMEYPIFYGSPHDLNALKGILKKRGIDRSKYRLWAFNATGSPHFDIIGEGSDWDAVQFRAVPGQYDISICKPSLFDGLAG